MYTDIQNTCARTQSRQKKTERRDRAYTEKEIRDCTMITRNTNVLGAQKET